MACGFCFAEFKDVKSAVLPKGHLIRDDALRVVEGLCGFGFEKINFAGGEPTLCPWLPDLIGLAKTRGLTTSIVTNGSRVTEEWLDRVEGSLDWVALSIDSVAPDTLIRIGRAQRGKPMSADDYSRVAESLRRRGVRLKVNTVVNRCNHAEDMTAFIRRVMPQRWKLLQAFARRRAKRRRIRIVRGVGARVRRLHGAQPRSRKFRDRGDARKQRAHAGQLRDGRPSRPFLRQRKRRASVQQADSGSWR